ncbi:MAG: hypothetical protein IMF12_02780 [Proteobacteria bacterium]|nr:hypothetical protein [Pseudomonadota bacterium]
MNNERYYQLDKSGDPPTMEEWNQGWHYCPEWDFMLVGPSVPEWECCACSIKDNKIGNNNNHE